MAPSPPPPPPHLVLLPSLGRGHLIPMLELSTRLAARGFIISLLLAPHHSPFARNRLAVESSSLDIRLLELDLPPNDTVNPQIQLNSNAKASNNTNHHLSPLVTLSQTLQRPVETLLAQMFLPGVDEPPPPLCIISDFFLAWTVEVAAKFGIPRINMETSPAYSMNIVDVLWSHLPRTLSRTASGRYVVPGQAKPMVLCASELTPGMAEADESHPKHLLYSRLFATNRQGSWATVSNTFYELEGDHIEQFQSRYAGPVRPVGPLLRLGGGRPASPEIEFLDRQAPGSVVYVSFGSENSISCGETIELALGLEASGKAFLWVLRRPSDVGTGAPGSDFLPDGFSARTGHRGRLVCGWTDQLAVLSHPAVGAFITHCGWNSALEGIACGVPMICWPLYAEQTLNAKFITEEAFCGLRMQKGPSREDIRRVVNGLIDADADAADDGARAVKENARKWKEIAKAAVSEGGSSAKNLDSLVEGILSLQKSKSC
uniref:Glycosyltransferase n=1 Tax=Wollemia nobilis TaxID=56998 RepID=A0A0C9QT92_9CONI